MLMANCRQSGKKDIFDPGMKKKRTIKINSELLVPEEFRALPANRKPDPDIFVRFKKTILSYYEREGRDLAWRHTTDPYHIFVSEIMLQQTQVARVTGKYPEFIDAFPTFPALAAAPFHDVLAKWQGLGYNRRALAIHQCAREVMTAFGGELPQDVEILATLPGIGHATACSIATFAFNMPVAFIETNIRRVFIHFFFGGRLSVTDREILPLVEQSLDTTNPRPWYWALMDFGSALKNTIPNPNKKSAHYTKQSKFVGSDREIRGMILRSLVTNPQQDEKELVRSISVSQERVHKVIDRLADEGFITRNGTTLMIGDR
jgi:A/G-specific adenine glycosylase